MQYTRYTQYTDWLCTPKWGLCSYTPNIGTPQAHFMIHLVYFKIYWEQREKKEDQQQLQVGSWFDGMYIHKMSAFDSIYECTFPSTRIQNSACPPLLKFFTFTWVSQLCIYITFPIDRLIIICHRSVGRGRWFSIHSIGWLGGD